MQWLSALVPGIRTVEFSKPTVHLYALCWNEAHMLPYFFRHYDSIVDRYHIFDNHSTDGSLELLKQHPRVILDVIDFDGPSFVESAQRFNNSCWKSSRGQADWVIVCNIDEHLYHPNLSQYLAVCRRRKISLIRPKGFEMVSDTFPTGSQPLYTQITTGMPSRELDKPQLFAPDLIDEINFRPGRHRAKPRGHVKSPLRRQVKLLHYKYLGLEYMSCRTGKLRDRLREGDIANHWGHKYLWDDRQKISDFERVQQAAVQVL